MGKPNVEKLAAKKDVEGLIKALGYKNDDVREKAAVALIEIGKPTVVPLTEAKKDVEGLIDALGYKKDSVKAEHAVVREQAAEALGEIGAKRAVKPLIQALHDKAWGVQYCAINALGNIGDRRAIGPIKQRVIETDKERVRGRGMIVLDEVFNLSKAELREIFLKSKASIEAKQQVI